MKQRISDFDNGCGSKEENEMVERGSSGAPLRKKPISTLRRGIADEGTEALPGPPRHDSKARLHHHRSGSRYGGMDRRVSNKESPPSPDVTVEMEQSRKSSPSEMKRSRARSSALRSEGTKKVGNTGANKNMKAEASHSKHAAAPYGSSSGIAYYPSSDDEVDSAADLYDVDNKLEEKKHNQRSEFDVKAPPQHTPEPRDTTNAHLSAYEGQHGDEYDIEKGMATWSVNAFNNACTDQVETETDDAAATTDRQNKGSSLSMSERVDQDNSDEAAPAPAGESRRNNATLVPGAFRILPPGGNPYADLEGSDDGESRGRSTVVPEIQAEYVDREEEKRRMREEIIQDAPFAEVQTNKWSPRTKRRVIVGGIALLVLAIAVSVSLGIILPKEPAIGPSEDTLEPTAPPVAPSAPPSTIQPVVPPTVAPTARPLDELLTSVSFDGGEALRTPSTPQNMAYEWLANSTNLDTYTDRRKIQRYSLATLYFSTNGNDWTENTNWLDDGDECGVWKVMGGVLECTGGGELVQLDLRNNSLVGTIPPEIGLLSSSLVHLFLWDNALSGSIPSEVGFLTTIRELWADFNELSGSIPSEIGRLTAMTYLDLESNLLSGSIPSEVGLLTAMNSLYLDKNQLIGTIPSVIHSMTNLEELLLYGNEFTGSFTCPDFIDSCWISCNPWETDFDDKNGTCRSL